MVANAARCVQVVIRQGGRAIFQNRPHAVGIADTTAEAIPDSLTIQLSNFEVA